MPSRVHHVLVVDDEASFAAMARDAAISAGFTASVADSGETARKHYTRRTPDIIVLDLMMPEESGLSFMRWLSEQQSVPPVVIVSGYNPDFATAARDLAEQHCMRIAVLQKPVRPRDLLATLDQQLG